MLCCNNQTSLPVDRDFETKELPREDVLKAENRKDLPENVHKMADRIDLMEKHEIETLKSNSELGKILKAIDNYLNAPDNENTSSGDFCKFLQGELEYSLLPKNFLDENKNLGLHKIPPYVNGILKEVMYYCAPWFDSSIDHKKNINKIAALNKFLNEPNSNPNIINIEPVIEERKVEKSPAELAATLRKMAEKFGISLPPESNFRRNYPPVSIADSVINFTLDLPSKEKEKLDKLYDGRIQGRSATKMNWL